MVCEVRVYTGIMEARLKNQAGKPGLACMSARSRAIEKRTDIQKFARTLVPIVWNLVSHTVRMGGR